MYIENKKNIEMVVKLLKEHNINNLVISPGGTNIPIVNEVQNDNFFKCYSVVDERSASYVAIGIYLQTGRPVAIICTSAQATRNYIPGLTEAFYKKAPILAITMEKHPRFKYQEYMQAPDQTSLPNDCVKKSFELPYIRDINDIYFSRRMINEAILELTLNGNGPVQLCIPWLDFKISDNVPINLSIERVDIDFLMNMDLSKRKILVVIGEHRIFSQKEMDAINYFCENTNSVIYTNHLSNFRNDYSLNANLLLSCITDKNFENIKPDILISIGGQTGDYPFYLRISKTEYNTIEHWRVSEDGLVCDTYDKLKYVFKCKEVDFFSSVKKIKINHTFYSDWLKMLNSMVIPENIPFSNVSIAQYLHKKIPNNSIIQFSILNSLRVWNLFDLDNSIECYSNVGAFGIDGGMSTLIGQSMVSSKLSFMIIGDLAFFYDMNSIGIRHVKNNLRIILVNNNGGVEFKLHGENKNDVDRYIAAANHFKNAEGWAKTCGFKYLSASNLNEFKHHCDEFLSNSSGPILFECFVSDNDEEKAYNLVINSNKKDSSMDMLKKSVKSIVGEKNIKILKSKMN